MSIEAIPLAIGIVGMIVGVPAFAKCEAGPSTRICFPNPRRCSRLM